MPAKKSCMIDLAVEVALKAHQNQVRKGTNTPYITHPVAVGLILAKAGCTDDVIVAGILHDTVEDTSMTLDGLRETFGDGVAASYVFGGENEGLILAEVELQGETQRLALPGWVG